MGGSAYGATALVHVRCLIVGQVSNLPSEYVMGKAGYKPAPRRQSLRRSPFPGGAGE